ncbi:MAG: hypothetical protein JKY29_05935 [Gammaproteobacteria bacterium]|nr:hypothetical protein [Gammaproteobacteria bacterium]
MNQFIKSLVSVQLALISVVAVAQDNQTYATYVAVEHQLLAVCMCFALLSKRWTSAYRGDTFCQLNNFNH